MGRSFRRVVAAGCLPAMVLAGVAATPSGTGAAPATARKAAPTNTLGVQVVRFAPGTSRAEMVSTIQAARGEITTDLSKLGRMAVRSDRAGFAAALRRNASVKAVSVDRVIRSGRQDVSPADASVSARSPQLGSPGPDPIPDPWHDLTSFLGETNPRGILQWDDLANGAVNAWSTTTGDRSVKVAVIDTGVTGSHKEILPNFDQRTSTNTIPCNLLTRQFGPLGQKDCSNVDTEGHGTWVASRIAGAVNGFASNGIAPQSTLMGFKALSTTLGGGLTSWIVDAMIRACDADADIINMSLGGYNHPANDAEDTLIWVDAVNYCRAKGTAIFASAGNEHVRINRVNMTVGGVPLTGVGQVDSGDEGIASVIPGDAISDWDFRGLIEVPAGIPGVVMVSSTGNANGAPPAGYGWQAGIEKPTVGALDQLAYYSNYGSRIDIAAPGGARKLGIPRYDGGPADILYGGWGELGALTANGEICQDPSLASPLTFTCFKVNGAAFGWLQGTSMSSPNAAGVAALVLAARPNLRESPDGLLARLQQTARTGMVNLTGPNDPANKTPGFDGTPCETGHCHLQFRTPISAADAYGAGIVNAGAAVS
jgi:subtilisin family serine protease